jgi:serine protease Do
MNCMYSLPSRCAAALLVVSLFVGRGAGTENEKDLRRSPTVKAVQRVKPSVVAVKVTLPGGSSGRSRDQTGTGLIIDERGYVVTNRHVIAGATRTAVRLLDGTELSAKVLVADPETDLAVLKVTADRKLPAQPLAPSTDLEEGEDVIAVGHPLGYTYTISRGIVSALNRKVPMPNGYVLKNLIQTDASINPGNSGGPLLNINGGVIGINVALREDAHGIAFAISSETVRTVLSKHLPASKVAGVSHGLSCREQLAAGNGRPQVVVAAVSGNTAAAGVKSGDVVLGVGRLAVVNAFDVERALWDSRPGEKVDVKVLRGDRELTVALPLANAVSEVASVSPRRGDR